MSPNNNNRYMGDFDAALPRIRRRNNSVDSIGEARKRRRGSPGGGGGSGSRHDRGSNYEPSVPRRASYGGRDGSRDYGGGGRDYAAGYHNSQSNSYGNGFSVSPPPSAPHSSVPYSSRPPPPMNSGIGGGSSGMPFGNKSRRLYVGNLPFNVGLTEQALVQFFSAIYIAAFRPQLNPQEALPCESVWLRSDGNFGFIELRGDLEAVNMMQLNGIYLHGRPLRINRPSDYHGHDGNSLAQVEQVNVQAIEELCAQLEGIVAPPADLRANNPNFVPKMKKQDADIPVLRPMSNGMENGKVQVKPTMNMLRSTPLQKPPVLQSRPAIPKSEPKQTSASNSNGHSNGNGNVNGNDSNINSNMNGNGGNGNGNMESKSEGEPSVESKSDRVSAEEKVTAVYGNVISLLNLVTDKDLDGTREDYDDLVDDVKTECGQYGEVVALEIPKDGPWRSTAFVEYAQKEHALAAVNALRARVFEGMKIEAQVVTECKSAKDAVERAK